MVCSSGDSLIPTPAIQFEAQDEVVNAFQSTSPVGGGSARPLNPIEDGQWDARLAAQGRGTFFQRTAWARTLKETYAFTPVYFATLAGGKIHALLPMMEVDSWLTGRRGVSLPFTDCCEPFAGDLPGFQRLFDQVVRYGQDRRWKYVEFRGGQQFLAPAMPSQRFYGHELALAEDEQRLFATLTPAVRRAVRKAERQGVTVEILKDAMGIRQFYALQCRTRRKHGLPPQPFRFFQNVQKCILAEGSGIIILARLGKRTVAGSIFFHTGQEAIYKFGASDEAMLELRGNDLVMWEGIKYYASKGFRKLHLGRTSPTNEGLRRFKLGWGAREHWINYFKYDLRKSVFVASRDEAFGWYNQVFAALPLSWSRFLGALLYRHVA
jgi:hypothetical protein